MLSSLSAMGLKLFFVLAGLIVLRSAHPATAGQHQLNSTLAEQAAPAPGKAAPPQRKAAKVVTDGFLLGWKGLFLLTEQPGGTSALFDCDSPVLNAKLKGISCVIKPRSATPFIVGTDGTLQGWHVDVSDSTGIQCVDPALSFSAKSISCPQHQSQLSVAEQVWAKELENAQLKSQLAEAQAELAKFKETAPSPVPFSITVATPQVHSFLCQAPALDLQARVLTCYEVSQAF